MNPLKAQEAPGLAGSGTLDYFPLWNPDGDTLADSAFQQSASSQMLGPANLEATPTYSFAHDPLSGMTIRAADTGGSVRIVCAGSTGLLVSPTLFLSNATNSQFSGTITANGNINMGTGRDITWGVGVQIDGDTLPGSTYTGQWPDLPSFGGLPSTGVVLLDTSLTDEYTLMATPIAGETANADQLRFLERSSDPIMGTEGDGVIWMSDGFGAGDDGDILVASYTNPGTTQTSGALIVGYLYEITTYVSTDDFINVGAASNANGVQFVASGTTPTDYTNGSTLTLIGVAVYTTIHDHSAAMAAARILTIYQAP